MSRFGVESFVNVDVVMSKMHLGGFGAVKSVQNELHSCGEISSHGVERSAPYYW